MLEQAIGGRRAGIGARCGNRSADRPVLDIDIAHGIDHAAQVGVGTHLDDGTGEAAVVAGRNPAADGIAVGQDDIATRIDVRSDYRITGGLHCGVTADGAIGDRGR